jgi:hypothetical protein
VSVSLPGDGEYVFLRLEDGNSYFLRLTAKGEVDFQKGPKMSRGSSPVEDWPLRDPQGGLWLVVDSGVRPPPRAGPVPPPMPTVVRRVTGPDKGQDFNGVGLPRVVDAAGCVWLTKGEWATIWAPGGKTSTLRIENRGKKDLIAAGEKGHVFALTLSGLQEYVAADPSKPGDYAPAALYRLEGMEGETPLDMQYSSLGYLAVVGDKPGQANRYAMHLFPVGPVQSVRKEPPHGAAGRQGEPKTATAAKAKSPSSAAPAASKLRTWHDTTGSFSVQAEFVSATAGVAKLRKLDGSTINVPMEKLSEEDQKYIRNRGK